MLMIFQKTCIILGIFAITVIMPLIIIGIGILGCMTDIDQGGLILIAVAGVFAFFYLTIFTDGLNRKSEFGQLMDYWRELNQPQPKDS